MASDEVVENLILAVEAMGLPEAAAAVDTLTGSVDDLAASIDRADVAVGGGEAEASGGFMKGLTSMKTLMAGLGIYEAVKQFSSFQSQMEKLRTQTGATQAEVGRMSKGVLSLATSVGTGPTSLAEALYHIQSIGIRGAESLNLLTIAAKGAKIGGASLIETTTAMTAVYEAGFRGVHSFAQGMAILNSTVGAGDMKMEDLNQALSTGLLATMKTLGISLQETGAAIATFGDNNIRGSRAANMLRMGLMMIAKPSEEAQKIIKSMGMSSLQLSEDLEKPNKGLLVMLKDLKTHMEGLSKAAQKYDMSEIFGGGRTSSGMFTLMNKLTKLKENEKKVAEGVKNFGADWKATTHNLEFFIDQVKALAEVWLIKLGSGLNWVAGGLEDLIEGFEKGEIWAVAFVGAIAGVATIAAISGAISMIGSLTSFVTGLFAVGESAGILSLLASGPWGWIILVGVALALLILKVKPVREVFESLFHWFEKGSFAAKTLAGVLGILAAAWALGKAKAFIGLLVEFATGDALGVLASGFYGAAAGVAALGVAIAPVLIAALALVGAVKLLDKILPKGDRPENLLGGNQPGEKSREGQVNFKKRMEEIAYHQYGAPVRAPIVTTSSDTGPQTIYTPKGNPLEPNSELPTPGGGSGRPLVIEIPLHLDRRQVSKSVIKTGLEAQSAR